MPFVMTTAASRGPMPEELIAAIKTSGRGLILPWAPQVAVLMHPATGWMLSHCGAGGIYEALSQGVPLICWPHVADQQPNASFIVDVVGAGFELLQVRTGPAATRAYRGGPDGTKIVGTDEAVKEEIQTVINACRGGEGAGKREAAKRAQKAIQAYMVPGGPAFDELEGLRHFIV
ncbi:glycosyltransferase family 1 protein, partial [Calocera cornea HHB12733]